MNEAARIVTPFDQRSGGGRDRVLDGLRAVAILSVIVGHAVLFRLPSFIPALPPLVLRSAGSLAVTGVEVFFLISGYVITRLLLSEQQATGRIDLTAFYVRRTLRILPAFYFYLLVITLISTSGYISIPINTTLSAASFLCNTTMPCHWFGGHSWSLAVEEQFYIVWPSLLVLLTVPRLVPFVSVIVLSLACFSLARGFVPFANNMSFLYIAIGVLIACSTRLQAQIVAKVGTVGWIAAALLLLGGIVLLPDRLMLIGKPLLLCLLVFAAANVRFVRVLLEFKATQMIGATSYSLYLWQQLFLANVTLFKGVEPPIVLLPLIVWFSWRFIETPGIQAGRHYRRKGPPTHRKPLQPDDAINLSAR